MPVTLRLLLALNNPSTLAIPLDLNVAELASPVTHTCSPAVNLPSKFELDDTFIYPVKVVFPVANVLAIEVCPVTSKSLDSVASPETSIVLLISTAPLACSAPVTLADAKLALPDVDNVPVTDVFPAANVLATVVAP